MSRILAATLTSEDLEWIEREALPLVQQPFARLLILILLAGSRRRQTNALGWKPVDESSCRYRELPDGSLEVDFGAERFVAFKQGDGTRSKGNPRYWIDHPTLGLIQRRGVPGFLKALQGAYQARKAAHPKK